MPHPMPDTPRPAARRKRGPPRAKLTRAQAGELFAALAADRPDPRTELDFVNPFTLLVAVALSAQATDVGVNKATAKLFAIADTPEKMLALGEEGVAAHIRTIGLWRNKTRNVIALSRQLIEEFGGEVPRTREALMTLPGVGRKTANVVLNEAFGEPTIAVDTHIFRVSNRTGLAPGRNPDEVEAGLERITPPDFKKGAHHWLILHGRYVCKARSPACWQCAIAHLCAHKPKTPDPAQSAGLGPKRPRRAADTT
ncbi:endonuclease III [Hyphomonas sp.]|uniref:endonuclease III n=1 Tax=Hyphomonas sp. TaxID=87 RepID=UPI003919EE49